MELYNCRDLITAKGIENANEDYLKQREENRQTWNKLLKSGIGSNHFQRLARQNLAILRRQADEETERVDVKLYEGISGTSTVDASKFSKRVGVEVRSPDPEAKRHVVGANDQGQSNVACMVFEDGTSISIGSKASHEISLMLTRLPKIDSDIKKKCNAEPIIVDDLKPKVEEAKNEINKTINEKVDWTRMKDVPDVEKENYKRIRECLLKVENSKPKPSLRSSVPGILYIWTIL